MPRSCTRPGILHMLVGFSMSRVDNFYDLAVTLTFLIHFVFPCSIPPFRPLLLHRGLIHLLLTQFVASGLFPTGSHVVLAGKAFLLRQVILRWHFRTQWRSSALLCMLFRRQQFSYSRSKLLWVATMVIFLAVCSDWGIWPLRLSIALII